MKITEEIIRIFGSWTKLKIRLHVSEDEPVYFREKEIWWASLGANIGYEQDGKNDNFERPVLILKSLIKMFCGRFRSPERKRQTINIIFKLNKVGKILSLYYLKSD